MSSATHLPNLTLASLFSGGMGLDLGLERAGFRVRFAADSMPAAVETIRANRPEMPVFSGDIRGLSGKAILKLAGLQKGELDLLSGGPPCQSFSTAGRRLGLDDTEKGPLLFEFVRLIHETQPRAFLLENVKGLLSASTVWRQLPYNNNGKRIQGHHGTLLDVLLDRIKSIGYSVAYQEVNAADYGVPQTRIRVFFIGYRDGRSPTFPPPSHSRTPGLFTRRWEVARPCLEGPESVDSHCARFSPRKMRYLKMVPPGGNWRDLPAEIQKASMGRAFFAKGGRCGYWRRLGYDEPAPTILTEPQNASTSLCHPKWNRPLSVSECARLQTFPDEWKFCGRGSDRYRLVGNAVPVRLAEAIGRHIAMSLNLQGNTSIRREAGSRAAASPVMD